jgi:hypothetical protein
MSSNKPGFSSENATPILQTTTDAGYAGGAGAREVVLMAGASLDSLFSEPRNKEKPSVVVALKQFPITAV